MMRLRGLRKWLSSAQHRFSADASPITGIKYIFP